METMAIGSTGSGIKKRAEKEAGSTLFFQEITVGNLTQVKLELDSIARKILSREVFLYINTLVGIRDGDIALFYALKEYFKAIAIILDGVDHQDKNDLPIIIEDTCSKFGVGESCLIMLSSQESLNKLLEEKEIKFQSYSEIALKASYSANIQTQFSEKSDPSFITSQQKADTAQGEKAITILASAAAFFLFLYFLITMKKKALKKVQQKKIIIGLLSLFEICSLFGTFVPTIFLFSILGDND